jgi:hypothetical protein
MRSARIGLLNCPQLAVIHVCAQQTQQVTSSTPTLQDPQAVSVLNQVLDAAGGVTALSAIVDYTGTGAVIYHWGAKDVQGTVTVSGRGSEANTSTILAKCAVAILAAINGANRSQ